MYWSMSPSRILTAAVYSGLPPLTPETSLSCVPPSSEYWIHRSASMVSKACKNLRIAMSPLVMGASPASSLSTVDASPGSSRAPKTSGKSPAPSVAAPAANIPFFKNARRSLPFIAASPFVAPLVDLRASSGGGEPAPTSCPYQAAGEHTRGVRRGTRLEDGTAGSRGKPRLIGSASQLRPVCPERQGDGSPPLAGTIATVEIVGLVETSETSESIGDRPERRSGWASAGGIC